MTGLPALLRRHEVAAIFGVDLKTPVRWANQGRLPAIRTPRGQRRWPLTVVVDALIDGGASREVAELLIRSALQPADTAEVTR